MKQSPQPRNIKLITEAFYLNYIDNQRWAKYIQGVVYYADDNKLVVAVTWKFFFGKPRFWKRFPKSFMDLNVKIELRSQAKLC